MRKLSEIIIHFNTTPSGDKEKIMEIINKSNPIWSELMNGFLSNIMCISGTVNETNEPDILVLRYD